MTSEQSQEYDDALVAVLEAVWGEGYMSPGGPDEIRMIVEGVPLAGKAVLDLGCGTGGITRFLSETYRPARIVGIDVDAGLIARATDRAAEAGLGNSLSFQTVTPGPLPFADGSFDVVFSKDAMVHIADKEALAMAQAGFRDIRMIDRNEWFRPLAHRDHDAVAGPLYDQLLARVGKAFLDHEIEAWRALTVVVDIGELRPGHLRARKPGK